MKLPSSSFSITIPAAPAACATLALVVNSQSPHSIFKEALDPTSYKEKGWERGSGSTQDRRRWIKLSSLSFLTMIDGRHRGKIKRIMVSMKGSTSTSPLYFSVCYGWKKQQDGRQEDATKFEGKVHRTSFILALGSPAGAARETSSAAVIDDRINKKVPNWRKKTNGKDNRNADASAIPKN
ncbi:diaminopimelate epimerase [Striga asiatica]|uniref:Diaminopimelate epimerase n=1 Tax=Striga asiatica TaxID=4170 RepID=A0A5A7Q6D8_STRAF|nr:diaminopimelate epimerase [Striga asiatica]